MKKIALIFTTLCLLQSAHGQTITSAVPGFISYQGRALDSTGAVIGSAVPVNRTVTFRVWDHASNVLLANLLYSEQQTVTISGGEFSVLIGQGVVTAGTTLGFAETTKGLPTVKIGDLAVFGGSTRYLGVTIDDGTVAVDNEITPRQQIVSSAYAFRAKYAEQLGSNGTAALTALDSGNVGIGNTAPPALFTVSGANTSTSTSTPQLLVTADDITERLRIGVDSTGTGTGFIQSFKEGTGAQNLLLNPSGGNVGIGTTAAAFPLSFAATTGDKISLHPGTAPSSYGFGIAANALQIHGNSITDSIVFGYGSSAAMTETMRIQGNGNVGIGTASPANKLTVAGGNVYVSGTNSGVQVANAGATKMVEMSIADSAGSFSTSAVAGDAVIRASGAAKLHLQTGSGASAISIDTWNNVTLSNSIGIGTSTPTNRFSLDAPASARSTSTTVTTATALAHIGASDSLAYFGSYDSSGGWGNWIQSMRSWDGLSFPLMLNPNGGNVGIGTAAPAYKLDVNGTARVTSDVYLNNNATINSKNTAGTSQVVFWPRADDNGTYLNYGTNGFFIRNNASAIKMVITDGGNVGIGTASPIAPLHVVGSALNSFTLDAYLDGNGVNNVWEARSDLSHSIIADGRVRAFAFDIASDLRIKNVQKISEGGEDLATLMKIEITDYLYKDVVAKGKHPQKKVIAQQVEKVYPQAVIQSTDVVPDLYKKAAVKDGWIELATDLKVGERVKLVGKTDQSVHEVLEVRDGAFRPDGKVDADHVFVYGREAKDFRSVDYDAIAMLNVSATQQVKREKDAEIQALRDENAALRRELAAKDESVEARLIALEQRLSKGSAPETVSIKTANVAK